TMVIYQFGMYPTKYNNTYGGLYSADQIGAILLQCEKYGLKFIGEFHPEARDIRWPYQDQPDPKPYAAVSRFGKVSVKVGEPLFNVLSPVCQQWYLNVIGEFADHYKASPAFQGVALRLMSWQNPGLNNFASLEWGYDDYTMGLFSRETGVALPVNPTDPQRYGKRYDWLMGHAKERWITWRCAKVADLYTKMLHRIRQAKPDLCIYTDIFDLGADLREAGIDVNTLSKIDGLVFVNGQHSYGRRSPVMDNQTRRDLLLAPKALDAWRAPGQPANLFFTAAYFEATGDVAIPEDLGYPKDTKRIWMSGVVNPAGRHSLERWAVGLAQGDATLLGDGGNAYTLGQPELRDFLREYRSLPAVGFTSRPDASDPVAVRQLARKQDFLFYAVNRERYPVQVTCALKTTGAIKRLTTGETLPLQKGTLSFTLAPYQLLTFTAPAGSLLTQVSTKIPAVDLQHVQAQVAWLQKLAASVKAGKGDFDALTTEQRATLAQAAEDARVSLAKGHYWHARTLMENHLLLAIYDVCNSYPPFLRYNGSPIAPAGALRAAELAKHASQAEAVTVVSSDTLAPNWAAEQLLSSTAREVSFTLDVPVDSRYRINIGHVSGGDFGPVEVLVNG
ncbi:MAG TPA: hypothetical protein VGL77_03040, partial [Armatimonadota bacterium]